MNIEVHQKPTSRFVEIFIWEERGDKDVFYTFDKGDIIAQTRERTMAFMDKDILPTFKMPSIMYRPFLEVMAKEAQNQGVATEREDHLKGKVDALQNHLADLQKMVVPMLAHIVNKKELVQ